MTPWQMYYAMNQVEQAGQAAWSTATATANKVDWLNLLNPTDVGNVKSALQASGSTIPPELAQLQSMTNQNWVTAATASAGYQAAINFIGTSGVGIISDGPFYVSSYSASTSPAFLVMKPNPGFSAGHVADPELFAPAVVITPQATIPPVVAPGTTFVVTAVQSPDGSPSQTSPAGNATIDYIFLSGGAVVYSSSSQTGTNGQATVTVPATIKPGTYLLNILASSTTSKLIQPLITSIVVSTSGGSGTTTSSTSGSGTTTSSTGSSNTSTTTSTTTTSSSNTTLYIGVAVVVLLIIVVAAAMFMRRGKRM
jgi:peptide/nickel transport system substrate-binding protein